MHAILNLALIVALIGPASAAYASNVQPAAANAAQSDYYEQPSSLVAQTPPPPPPTVASDSGSAYPMKPPSAGAVNNVRPRPPPPAPAVRNSDTAAYRPPPPAQMVAVRPRPLATETMQEVPCDHTMTVAPQAASTSIKVMYKTVTLAARPTTVTLAARPTTVVRTVTRNVMPTAQAVQPTYTSVINVAAARPTAAAANNYAEMPPPPAAGAAAADKDCEESTGGALADSGDAPMDQMPEEDMPQHDEAPTYPKYPWDGPEPEWPRDNVPDESNELPIDEEEDWPIDEEEDWPIDEEEDWPIDEEEDWPIDEEEDWPIDEEEDWPIDEQDPTNPADPMDPTDPMDPIDEEPFPPFDELPVDAQDNSEEIRPHHLVRRAIKKPTPKPRKTASKSCKVNTFQCNGRTSFQKCDHGKWFNFRCAPGTVCVKKAQGAILCDWPKST